MNAFQTLSEALKNKNARIALTKCLLSIAIAFIVPHFIPGLAAALATSMISIYLITNSSREFAVHLMKIKEQNEK